MLVADTPRNVPLIRAFFAERSADWSATLTRKGIGFYRRTGAGLPLTDAGSRE